MMWYIQNYKRIEGNLSDEIFLKNRTPLFPTFALYFSFMRFEMEYRPFTSKSRVKRRTSVRVNRLENPLR